MTYTPNPLRPDPKPKPTLRVKKALSKTAKPKSELPALEKVADAAFSRAIRLQAANKYGFVRCVTCTHAYHYTQMQLGHFISRSVKALRWDERNCAPQCPECNILNWGSVPEFAIYIDKKHGNGTANRLLREAKQPFKLEREFVQEVINKYKAKKK